MIFANFLFEALPGQRAAFRDLLVETMKATQPEPGCINYVYTADLENPDRFHLSEIWASDTEMQDHIDQPHSHDFVRRVGTLGRIVSARAVGGAVEKVRIRAPGQPRA